MLPAAVVRAAPEAELAAAFVAFLTSPEARARLAAAGFRSPPATP
jgi:ABC-type molybdate transport system substrate-binding protein